MNLKVVSYNSRGLHLGQSIGDKVQCSVGDKLLENADIVCVQDTFLSEQDVDKLNIVINDLYGVGESTTDLSMGILRGRIPGGVGVFWHKKYEPLISVIRLDVNSCIGIKVEHNVFIILNVYTPYECCQNEDEYINRLAFLSCFIKASVHTCIFIVGDMNADISDKKSLFGQHLIRFCKDNKLKLSSQILMPEDSYT